jgi:uncharacterized ubiquitin-like protein YukD
MDTLNLNITDATGTKSQAVSVPASAPAIRVIARVVQAMDLPLMGPDGTPLSYKFHHRTSGRQLRDDDELGAAGVRDGDSLRLVAEITAG